MVTNEEWAREEMIKEAGSKKFFMKCEHCGTIDEERKIELSHDVPRYIGGTDLDGRRYLCHQCHQAYEIELLRLFCMKMINISPPEFKKHCREIAREVNQRWFR